MTDTNCDCDYCSGHLTGTLGRCIGPRPLRRDLTPLELFRLEEYGSIHFESAGATRKR